ncbi:unnamed protein product [Candida verbasci]|uniref:AB hydrolase-1 domain-containing protein n=1 Tax=Candida verbasci TaxID=1227364 RepID=A0A9W4X9V4_9ASCO|nr:unnamed protein product [Candida verbasci]
MGILNWGFRSNIKLHQKEDSINLKSNDGDIKFTDFTKKLTLIDPTKKLWLNPLLFNGSLQTLYYTSMDSSKKFQVYYGRETFKYKDGGTCSLDWVIPKHENFKQLYQETLPQDSPRLHPRTRFLSKEELSQLYSKETETPIVVICHGLAGGSHESLIRNLAENIERNCDSWDRVVINNRGCCRTKLTSGTLFNAGSTNDIREVLQKFKKTWPNRPIYLCGFSFGGALVTNFLGEEGDSGLVKAACAVGCPFDFVDSAYHIQSSLTGKYLLSPALTQFLSKIVFNNKKEIMEHSDLINDEKLAKLKTIKNTYEFDQLITCKTTPYANAFEYYRELSPLRQILNIKTPFMMINSTDDPAVGVNLPIIDINTNPYLLLVETDLGGHLGYVKSNGDFWCVEVVEQFFQKFQELIK